MSQLEMDTPEPLIQLGSEFEVPPVDYDENDPSLNLRLQVQTKIALMDLKEMLWGGSEEDSAVRRRSLLGAAAGTVCAAGAIIGIKNGLYAEFVNNDSVNKYPMNILGQVVCGHLMDSRFRIISLPATGFYMASIQKAQRCQMPIFVHK